MPSTTPAKAAAKPRKRAAKPAPKPTEGDVVQPTQAEVKAMLTEEGEATAKATKRTVAKGAKQSEVVTLQVPTGAPATRSEWDALVIAAKNEHKAYDTWRVNGQPGGAKDAPKRPSLDLLHQLKADGHSKNELPEDRKPRKGGTRTGSIPAGKTSAGLARMDDAGIVKWIKGQDGTLGHAALHRRFRDAGYGANAKRFAKLVQQAR